MRVERADLASVIIVNTTTGREEQRKRSRGAQSAHLLKRGKGDHSERSVRRIEPDVRTRKRAS